jgi:glycerol-3-phosphate responsive antiterminator
MKVPITDHEESLVIKYIYINYLTETLEQDLSNVEKVNFKLISPYLSLIESTLQVLRLELKKLKEEMKKMNIKVDVANAQIKNEEFMEYHFFVRGYHGTKRIFIYHLRNESSRLLSEYFTGKKPL